MLWVVFAGECRSEDGCEDESGEDKEEMPF